MKILVASAFPAGSRLAHAINTIKMADGFAKLGRDVVLVCRHDRKGPVDVADLRRDFGLSPRLAVIQMARTVFGRPLNDDGHFAWQAALVALHERPDFAYCRSYVAPVALARLGIPTVAESHAHPGDAIPALNRLARGLARSKALRGLVTIAPVLKENFVRLGAPADKVWVLPDAVDLSLFRRPPDFDAGAKRQRPCVVYAGHLYDYKGIPTVLAAAELLPGCDFVLVGGTPEDIARHRTAVTERKLVNVFFLGLLAHTSVPEHLWNADVLLLPPSARHPSAQWTSPVKLGEYLASGTPVVATRIPALEYWLRNDEVCFVNPDDPPSLAEGIVRVLGDRTFAGRLVQSAAALAEGLAYESRCRRILSLAGAAEETGKADQPGHAIAIGR